MQQKKQFLRTVLTTIILALALSSLQAQPVTSVTFESRDLTDQETMHGQMYFRHDVLRIDGESGSGSGPYSMIFRGDLDLLWFLQHDQRKYIEMDRQTIERMSNQISDVLAQVQEQLKDLNPQQREALERMMKGRLPVPDQAPASLPEIRATGERAEISGYPCLRYDVFQDGSKVVKVWATSRSRIPGTENVHRVFKKLADFYKSITQGFAQFQTGFNFNVLAELDDFPIKMLNYEDGQLQSEMLIKMIEQRPGSDDLFERPQGYEPERMNIPR